MENEEQNNKPVEIVNATALESIERASIDMQIETAKRHPMHRPGMLSKVKEDMLTLATLDEETAAACFYTLPRGGKAIQGPSVRLAEIALNCYGNTRVGTRIIDVVTDYVNPHVVIQSACHDLENNVLITIEKRRRITKKKKAGRIDEDDIQLAVNACTSIAYRDATFKIIPMAIIKPVWQAAKLLAVGDIRSLTAKRSEVIEKLKKMGAPEDRILAVVNCRKAEDIGVDELGQLIGLGTALKDGEITLEDAFPLLNEPVTSKTGVAGLRDKLSAQKEKEKEIEQNAADKFGTPEEIEAGKKKAKKATKRKSKKEAEIKDKEGEEKYKHTCFYCGEGYNEPSKNSEGKELCPNCLKRIN